jgi:transcriptional regulator GlxA family with amidase domain
MALLYRALNISVNNLSLNRGISVSMKTIAIVIFDHFTDIDLFLMWDILGREKSAWKVQIIGTKTQHISCNGLYISTHGDLSIANKADVVLFSSGIGTREIIKDQVFINSLALLHPDKQLIGSICSGALILGKLGLLNNLQATTHPRAKFELEAMGVEVIDKPFISQGNIATAGGCLSAQYLSAWVIDKIHGENKRKQILSELFPVGQKEIYENLVNFSLSN